MHVWLFGPAEDAECSICAFVSGGQSFISPSDKSGSPLRSEKCLCSAGCNEITFLGDFTGCRGVPSALLPPWRFCGLQKVCKRWMSVIKIQAVSQLKLKFSHSSEMQGFSSHKVKRGILKLSMGVGVCVWKALLDQWEKITQICKPLFQRSGNQRQFIWTCIVSELY